MRPCRPALLWALPGPIPAQAQLPALRPLQMRIAWHDGLLIFLRLFAEHGLEFQKIFNHAGNLIAQIEPEIKRHLIVPASCRVQALSGVTDARCENCLNIHVDVFVVGGKLDVPRLHILQNAGKTGLNGVAILFCQNPAVAGHLRVRFRAHDVLLVEPLVKGNGSIEVVDKLVGRLLEASCP